MRKFNYYWIVQGWYGPQYKWEDLCAEESYKDAKRNLRAYIENDSSLIDIRIVKRRELNYEVAKNYAG